MNTILPIEKRNAVLTTMATLLEQEREALKNINKQDLANYSGEDLAMEKRLNFLVMRFFGLPFKT